MKGKYPNNLRAVLDRSVFGGNASALGRKIGASRTKVSRWITGERELGFHDAKKMAPFLGTTVDEILSVPMSETQVDLIRSQATASSLSSSPDVIALRSFRKSPLALDMVALWNAATPETKELALNVLRSVLEYKTDKSEVT